MIYGYGKGAEPFKKYTFRIVCTTIHSRTFTKRPSAIMFVAVRLKKQEARYGIYVSLKPPCQASSILSYLIESLGTTQEFLTNCNGIRLSFGSFLLSQCPLKFILFGCKK